MSEPRQKLMSIIGKDGCYLLSLVYCAEKFTRQRIDAVEVYEKAVSNGMMERNCFVIQPDAIMQMMTGRRWGIRHDTSFYRPKDNEYMIMRYETSVINKTYSHFVVCAPDGSVEYDPFGASSTVRDGKAVSSRILTLL